MRLPRGILLVLACLAGCGKAPRLAALPAGIYETLATEEKLPLVANVFADVLSDPALKADAIHPNAHGYRRLAEGIATALRETGLLASR